MAGGKGVAGPGQVVVFIDQTHIDAGGTGLAVVAVDAAAGGAGRGELPDAGIVPRFGRGLGEIQQGLQIVHAADAGDHRQHAGPVQRILQALEAGQGLMEGRFRLGEELAGKKGFMTEMPTPSA